MLETSQHASAHSTNAKPTGCRAPAHSTRCTVLTRRETTKTGNKSRKGEEKPSRCTRGVPQHGRGEEIWRYIHQRHASAEQGLGVPQGTAIRNERESKFVSISECISEQVRSAARSNTSTNKKQRRSGKETWWCRYVVLEK